MKFKLLKVGSAALAAALLVPLGANAESSFATGNGALNTSASVDFQVTIPQFVYLRVGSDGAAIDLVDFTVPVLDLANGTPVAGTGGDLGTGSVTAIVAGNGGDISLQAATGGPLGNGAGGTIDWSQITTASNNGDLPAPVLANGASGNVNVVSAAGVVVENATWTYTYANALGTPPAAGTYGGVNVNNGRVTYTASAP